MTAANILNLF